MVVVTCISYLHTDRTLCVGTEIGFCLIKCDDSTPFSLFTSNKTEKWDVSMILQEVGCRRILFVTKDHPRMLNVYDTQQNKRVRNLNFTANITGFQINDKIIVVKVSCRLHIFNSSTIVPIGDVVTDVEVDSPALTMLGDTIAFPQCDVGQVGILKTIPSRQLTTITCFEEQIAALEFSVECRLLAVAPVAGKLIRVYNTEDGGLVFKFVRGLMRSANITSMFFYNLEFLVVASDTGSVHIFKLNNEPQGTLWGSITSMLWSSMRFLPIESAGSASEQRSMCSIKLPCGYGYQNKAFLVKSSNNNFVLHVGSSSGWFYEFNIDKDYRWLLLSKQNFSGVKYWGLSGDSDISSENEEYTEGTSKSFFA